MPESSAHDGWTLIAATEADMDTIIGWFPDSESVRIWGGPRFRYPFTRKTFLKDCHWGKMRSYSLRSPTSELTGFGQLYERIGRINMARLVIRPDNRGNGAGRRLIESLMRVGGSEFDCPEFSLFVYRNNIPALTCYKSMGFEIADYPPKAPLADECYYLTRPVDGR